MQIATPWAEGLNLLLVFDYVRQKCNRCCLVYSDHGGLINTYAMVTMFLYFLSIVKKKKNKDTISCIVFQFRANIPSSTKEMNGNSKNLKLHPSSHNINYLQHWIWSISFHYRLCFCHLRNVCQIVTPLFSPVKLLVTCWGKHLAIKLLNVPLYLPAIVAYICLPFH